MIALRIPSARKDSVNTELNSTKIHKKSSDRTRNDCHEVCSKPIQESQGEGPNENANSGISQVEAVKSSGHATMQTEQAKRSEVVSEAISPQPSKG